MPPNENTFTTAENNESNRLIALYTFRMNPTKETLIEATDIHAGTDVISVCATAIEIYETLRSITDPEISFTANQQFWKLATIAMNLNSTSALEQLGTIFDRHAPTGP